MVSARMWISTIRAQTPSRPTPPAMWRLRTMRRVRRERRFMGITIARTAPSVVVRCGEPISSSGRRRASVTVGGVPGLRRDAAVAAALAAAGVVEVLLLEDGGAVSAVAIVVATLPLAWRRRVPLLPLAAIAIALIADSALDGILVGRTATPLVGLAIALFSAGRYSG